jgi:hypothetical protein
MQSGMLSFVMLTSRIFLPAPAAQVGQGQGFLGFLAVGKLGAIFLFLKEISLELLGA